MTIGEGHIILKGMLFHAYHGVLPQERQVGAAYRVDLSLQCDLSRAAKTDRLDDTLNYAALYALVEQQMQQPSRLLEHVAGRIVKAIDKTFPEVTSIDLELTKLNPPMGADCDGAGVEIHWEK
jgi:dihydroneopterin aldolase